MFLSLSPGQMYRKTGVVSEADLTGVFGVDITHTLCFTDTENGGHKNTKLTNYKTSEHLPQIIRLLTHTLNTCQVTHMQKNRHTDFGLVWL